MITRTEAIVISAIKYGDTSLIVKCLTAANGVRAYLLKGILTSRKGKLKTAYFQPLTQLEIIANHKDNNHLQHIREARIQYPYKTIHTTPEKNAIVLFLSEILNDVLREEEENKALFQYIKEALQWLDLQKEIVNFHLIFLINLTKYLGFYPNTKNKDYPFFDLQEGEFTVSTSLNPTMANEELILLKDFLGTNFDDSHTIKMKKEVRQKLLQLLMQYYQLHMQGFKQPKSLSVFNEVFN